MNRARVILGGLVLAVAAAAFWVGLNSQKLQALRLPASVGSSALQFPIVNFEIENSGDDNLIRQIKLRLLQSMEWAEDGRGFQLKLGGFQLKTQGQSQSACEHYRQVTIRLVATGVAIAGESPQLTVTADCQQQEERILFPTLFFDDVRLNVQGRSEWDEGQAHYSAHLLDEEWFLEWDIREIELIPRHQAPAILIDGVEIHAVRPGAGAVILDL